MTTIRYFPLPIAQDWFIGHYYPGLAATREKDANHILLVAGSSGNVINFIGHNLTYDASGVPNHGVINRVEFMTASGTHEVTISQGKYSAASLFDTFIKFDTFSIYINLLNVDDLSLGSTGHDYILDSLGNDTVRAGDGSDIISAGEGNDRITGGAGVDQFFYHSGDGRDVITDFHATGTTEHDYVKLQSAEYQAMHAVKHGTDVILKFAPGDAIVLLGVHLTDITPDDFILI
jgi:Ca2+-binding RTX toxin-like protein